MEITLPAAIAFQASTRIAQGSLADVALRVKHELEQNPHSPVLALDGSTSELLEFDLRGSDQDVLARLPAPDVSENEATSPDAGPRGPGRPRLGVVPKEVTLLPRHWEWLDSQPGGASVTLRRLVEEARKANAGRDRKRMLQNRTYRFMQALAGNEPGFEEANRALFAGQRAAFEQHTALWPPDVRVHARSLADGAFD